MPFESHPREPDARRRGGAKTGLLLWLVGVPIPIILVVLLIQSCT